MVWFQTLASVVAVSLLSLSGAAMLMVRDSFLAKAMVVLVPFAAGALLGDAFLHMIPEMVEEHDGFPVDTALILIAGVLVFFCLEKVLHWHHAHFPSEEMLHPVATSNLVGDALHNLIDGTIIAASYLASTEVGVATTIAVVLHEIPQEFGDFAVLVKAGMKPRQALRWNLVSALAAVVGAILALLIPRSAEVSNVLLPIGAGAFVYIASTDLLPELHKEPEPRKSIVQVLAFAAGVAVMALLTLAE